jgi:acyl-CoA reductase-like NAD-dependent aldehyde dehydrogenase
VGAQDRACDRGRLGAGQPGARPVAGHSYGGYKESGIGREFSLEGVLDSFTQKKNVTVNLNV